MQRIVMSIPQVTKILSGLPWFMEHSQKEDLIAFAKKGGPVLNRQGSSVLQFNNFLYLRKKRPLWLPKDHSAKVIDFDPYHYINTMFGEPALVAEKMTTREAQFYEKATMIIDGKRYVYEVMPW